MTHTTTSPFTLSIVVPAYNEEKNIAACITAILQQTQNQPVDIEVIVVNNASTDATEAIARSYAEVTVVNEERKGIVWARRAGCMAAHGDLIANIDADSRLLPGWIDLVFHEFETHPHLVALSGPCVYDGVSRTVNALVRLFYMFGYATHVVSQYVFRTGAMLQGGNYVVKKDVLERMGGFDTSISFYGEDADIAKRISKFGKVTFHFKLNVLTSSRRFASEGLVRTALTYAVNYLWIMLFKKPFSRQYKDIRPE